MKFFSRNQKNKSRKKSLLNEVLETLSLSDIKNLDKLKSDLKVVDSLEKINDLIKYIAKDPDLNFGGWVRNLCDENNKNSNKILLYEIQAVIIEKICFLSCNNNSSRYTNINLKSTQGFIDMCSNYINEKSIEEKRSLSNILNILHNIRIATIEELRIIKECKAKSLELTQSLTSKLSHEILEEVEKINNPYKKENNKESQTEYSDRKISETTDLAIKNSLKINIKNNSKKRKYLIKSSRLPSSNPNSVSAIVVSNNIQSCKKI